jgi:hypothetical protein
MWGHETSDEWLVPATLTTVAACRVHPQEGVLAREYDRLGCCVLAREYARECRAQRSVGFRIKRSIGKLDRLLVAQARQGGMAVITFDASVTQYDVAVIW